MDELKEQKNPIMTSETFFNNSRSSNTITTKPSINQPTYENKNFKGIIKKN